jgi:2-polyprenyl-6-methoxyphenol hydroxylase-like FAD-dependent oxidoreductase
MLAIELGRRGIPVIVTEEKTSPARFPAANATEARTMEHYRRLGFAEEIRALGLPGDYPTDIAYFDRYVGHELARFRLPSAQAARAMIRTPRMRSRSKRSASTAARTQYYGRPTRWVPTAPAAPPASRSAMI